MLQNVLARLKSLTRNEPNTQSDTINVVPERRDQPSASWKKASVGWHIEIEIVTRRS